MALLMDYINEENQTIPNCYWRIGLDDGFSGGKEKLECRIYCYENKEQADLNQNELHVHEIQVFYDWNAVENVLAQIYKEIKEYEFFENAIDA